jgi:hypothetical protein
LQGGELDRGLLGIIEKKIADENLEGPDYLELKSAAEERSLVQEEPDEGKRWRQAYRNMKVFFPQANLNKAKILGSINHYIGIVDRELEIGLGQLSEAREKGVIKEQGEVKTLSQEIENLEREISEKRRLREEKERLISENSKKYDSQEQSFRKTLGYAKNILENDKNKINNYITD